VAHTFAGKPNILLRFVVSPSFAFIGQESKARIASVAFPTLDSRETTFYFVPFIYTWVDILLHKASLLQKKIKNQHGKMNYITNKTSELPLKRRT